MPGLPTWAEKFFSLQCTEGDAIASRPDEDQNGWDFLVEFPERNYVGPPESRPPKHHAFCQVKSTVQTSRTVSIKLSNMLNACRSAQPWFVVLVARSGQGGQPQLKVYAVHIWKDLMERSLLAVRSAGLQNKKLNKLTLAVTFSDDDIVEESKLVGWMETCIEGVGPHYQSLKTELYNSLGYEETIGTGTMVLEASSEKEITEAFLGMRSISASELSFTPKRFGISDPRPLISGRGTVTIEPTTIDTCQVKLRARGKPAMILDGKVYPYAVSGIPKKKKRIRFSTPPLDIIASYSGKCDVKINFDGESPRPLLYYQTFCYVMSAINGPDISYEVWAEGKRALWGALSFDSGTQPLFDCGLLCQTIGVLSSIASGPNATKVALSLPDLNAADPDLAYLTQTLTNVNIRLVQPVKFELPADISHIVYYSVAKVSRWHFGRLVKRKVIEDFVEDDNRVITASCPETIDNYFFENASAQQLSSIEEDYKQALEEFDPEKNLLGAGNICQAMRSVSDN